MADVYDGAWRLFSYDATTGRSVWVLHQDGRMVFRTDYPVENLIRDNAAARVEAAGSRFGELSRVASIPLNVYHDSGFAKAHREGDSGFMRRFLNDSDNSAWRTKEGRL